MTKKYAEIKAEFVERLTRIYPPKEVEALFYYYIDGRFDLKKHVYVLNKDKSMPEKDYLLFQQELELLEKAFPVQYLLGTIDFMGMIFSVDGHVLIPRPETEELVRLILDEYEGVSGKKVLDIGTGSGIIAVSLAKHLQEAKVSAIDISPGALQVAKHNAMVNNVSVDFQEVDVLYALVSDFNGKFDIIVSNPPYIPAKEEANLHANVVKYEPASALFVPDDDPLVFLQENHRDSGGYLIRQWVGVFRNL
ncbi:peptide chain release factor N(5)-glutamine methyltransferase [Bacteroidales bacterium OttesenSCG-928-C03]|nr:peptide chain release factor N(5)-glutamine methyltransferase [Bacteroidales bacterium OttesenSCG-928-C03]